VLPKKFGCASSSPGTCCDWFVEASPEDDRAAFIIWHALAYNYLDGKFGEEWARSEYSQSNASKSSHFAIGPIIENLIIQSLYTGKWYLLCASVVICLCQPLRDIQ
jgi:hypothetical protein